MKRIIVLFGFLLLGGCEIQIPFQLLGCAEDADCPNELSCVGGLCGTVSKCEPESWEELASIVGQGLELECGDLLNRCGGTTEGPDCPAGETCGENYLCVCEEVTCANYVEGGAQCGSIPSRCVPGTFIDCGSCAGSSELCEDYQCVCPDGVQCDAACPGGCAPTESCVDGVCCVQEFPCQSNECSPPAGFSNGCGKPVDCGECNPERAQSCVQQEPSGPYTCVGCCEQKGFECGFCDGLPCGQCALGEQCEDGRCVAICRDEHEPNDSAGAATLLCKDECESKEWKVTFSGVLDGAFDQDHFVFLTPHTGSTFIAMSLTGSIKGREMALGYVCPDGTDGVEQCGGSIDGPVCRENAADTMWITRSCKSEGTGSVFAMFRSAPGAANPPVCEPYTLQVWTLSPL